VCLAALPALGLILYTGLEERDQAAAQAQQEALRMAHMASTDQKRFIQETHYLLISLAERAEMHDVDSPACSLFLADELKKHPHLVNLGVISADGELLCSAIPPGSPISGDDRAYFRRVMETKRFAVGEYQVGRITGKASINFGYPIGPENSLQEQPT
jgi:hypothetical protein